MSGSRLWACFTGFVVLISSTFYLGEAVERAPLFALRVNVASGDLRVVFLSPPPQSGSSSSSQWGPGAVLEGVAG